MILWVDAQLSPALAPWLKSEFGLKAVAVRDLALRDATDLQIFTAAREAKAVVLTKDLDFVLLLERLGPPPSVLWLTCGNTSNVYLKDLLLQVLPGALKLLRAGESFIEITDIL